MKMRNDTFAKKLIADTQKKVIIEQKLLDNQIKHKKKLENLGYLKEFKQKEIEDANDLTV